MQVGGHDVKLLNWLMRARDGQDVKFLVSRITNHARELVIFVFREIEIFLIILINVDEVR